MRARRWWEHVGPRRADDESRHSRAGHRDRAIQLSVQGERVRTPGPDAQARGPDVCRRRPCAVRARAEDADHRRALDGRTCGVDARVARVRRLGIVPARLSPSPGRQARAAAGRAPAVDSHARAVRERHTRRVMHARPHDARAAVGDGAMADALDRRRGPQLPRTEELRADRRAGDGRDRRRWPAVDRSAARPPVVLR